MAQVGNKYFNNIAGVGETPIYQRTGGGAGNNETSNLGVLNASFSTNAFKSAGLPGYALRQFQGLSSNYSSGSGANDYYIKAKNISGKKLMLISTSRYEVYVSSSAVNALLGQTMKTGSNGGIIASIVSATQAGSSNTGLYNPVYSSGPPFSGGVYRNPVHVCVEPDAEVFLLYSIENMLVENNYQVLTSWMGHSADEWHAAGLAGTVSSLGFDEVAPEIWYGNTNGSSFGVSTNISIEGTSGFIQ
jgi:hypothetical protein